MDYILILVLYLIL